MAGEAEQIRQWHWRLPPMADTSANSFSNEVAVACSSTAVVLDLSTMQGLPATWPLPDGNNDPTPLGHYLTIQADGGVIYALFGPTYASVSGITTTTTNTVAGAGVGQGTITPLINVACAIPALSTGAEGFFKLHKGSANAPSSGPSGTNSPVRFLALICAGAVTATARLRQGSI